MENSEKAVLAGRKNELIMSARYDDLACVFAGMKGILNAESKHFIDVLAVFDNEEVGSLPDREQIRHCFGILWRILQMGLVYQQIQPVHGKREVLC